MERMFGNMKKIASAFLAALLVIASLPAVLAAESPSLTVAENNINTAQVTLQLKATDSKGKSATLRVYAETAKETIDNMLWADENMIGADGTCSFTVNMSNYDTGKYIFVSTVSGKNEAFRTEALQIYGSGEKTDLLNKMLAAKTNGTISEVKWVAENRWEYLSLDKTGYDLIPTTAISESTTESYLDVFCKNVLQSAFTTLDEFKEKFNKTVEISALYTTTDAKKTTDELLKSFALTKSKTYEAYSEEEELALVAATALKDGCLKLTADNFAEQFHFAVVHKLLSDNTQTWSGYATVLGNYADVIGIDTSDYADLTNQSVVIDAMIAKNDGYTSFQEIASDFEAKVAAQKTEEGKTSTDNKKENKTHSSGGFSGGTKVPEPVPTPTEPTQEPSGGFSDMASCPWAEEAVNYLFEKGIVSGRDDGSFDPNGSITRAEAVKLLVTAFGLTEEGEELSFTDVPSDRWYYRYIRIAFAAGLISGVSESEFAPETEVSRQDMAVLLDRVMNRENTEEAFDFSDGEQIADYAKQAVANLAALGVVSGTDEGSFEPSRNTTRAQAAKMLYEIIRTEVR